MTLLPTLPLAEPTVLQPHRRWSGCAVGIRVGIIEQDVACDVNGTEEFPVPPASMA